MLKLSGSFTKLAAGATLVFSATAANAALFSIQGGTAIVTDSASAGINDVLASGATLHDNAVLATTANNVKLKFFFWGSESGYTNTLTTSFGSHAESDNANGSGSIAFPGLGTPLFSGVQASAGNVAMSFASTGGNAPGGIVAAGAGDAWRSIAFAYLNKDGSFSATPTNLVGYAFDDSGAGPDDNHDDYVGYVQAVPIPAAAWLFGSGLMALVGLRRRKA
jgi:hypothetical protein